MIRLSQRKTPIAAFFGLAIGLMLGGWIMDHGRPRLVFYASVCFMLLTVATALRSERRSKRRALAPAE